VAPFLLAVLIREGWENITSTSEASVRLLLVEPDGSAHLARIEAAARDAGLQVARWPELGSHTEASLLSMAAVLAVGPSTVEPVQVARRLRDLAPHAPLLLLTSPTAEAASPDEDLRLDPHPEHRWEPIVLSESAQLATILRGCAEQALRQQRHLKALERIGRQLAGFLDHAHGPAPAGGLTAAPRAEVVDHYLASILAQASDAILSTDGPGQVLTWNAAAEHLFGHSAETMIGRPLSLLDPDAAPRNAKVATLAQVAARVRRTGLAEQVDVVCRRGDGSLVEVAASVAPLRAAAGRLLGLSVIARDVSERRRVEEALREANRQKDAFLAIMSHELRTPLTAILGYTDMLLRGRAGPSSERATAYLEAVRDAGHRLLGMVNGLLEYSRLETEAERLRLQPLHLARAVEHAVERVRADARVKKLELQAAIEDVGCVLAEGEKLQQILLSFLANAVKFTAPGGTIRIEAGQDPDVPEMARVGVRDTGIGLNPDQLERVWERFYQVDASLTRQHGGMGMGLALARRLAALHGGRVWAESPGPGRGSTFWLALPLAAPAPGTGASRGAPALAG
jgi:PAS domain S-box-containing protein